METFSVSLAIFPGNSPVTVEFSERPVTRSFDVFFDLRLNKRLNENGKAGDLRSHRAHFDVTVICKLNRCNYVPLYYVGLSATFSA